MQLHASLDVYSAVPFSVASQATSSRVFWLDREVMSEAFTAALTASKAEQEDGRSRRVREIQEESWDLFLRVFSDGSLVVQALAVSKCQDSFYPVKLMMCFRTSTADLLHSSSSSPCCSPLLLPSRASLITCISFLIRSNEER